MSSLSNLPQNEHEVAQEALHWLNVSSAFTGHKKHCDFRAECKYGPGGAYDTNKIPKEMYEHLFQSFKDASSANHSFFEDMIESQTHQFSDLAATRGFVRKCGLRDTQVPKRFFGRCDAVLQSLVREWSTEGRVFREATFSPLLSELSRLLPVNAKNAYRQNVLVPGAGLGRLGVEICAAGYNTQMNEYSVFMIICSHYMVNCVTEMKVIYPWLSSTSNLASSADALQTCQGESDIFTLTPSPSSRT